MERQDPNFRGQKSDLESGAAPQKSVPLSTVYGEMEALGFRQGKLFCSPERLTLTFFMGDQVASIHFDLSRREIFFKGHNVKNMTLSRDQWEALRNFSKLIKQEECDIRLIQGYEECLAQILPRL